MYEATINLTLKSMKDYLCDTIETVEEIKKMSESKIIKDYFQYLDKHNETWFSEHYFNGNSRYPDFIDMYHTINEYGLREAIKKFGKGEKKPTTETLYRNMKKWAFKKRNATK